MRYVAASCSTNCTSFQVEEVSEGFFSTSEISLIDMLATGEPVLVLQKDLANHINRTNRAKCSWEGYTALHDGVLANSTTNTLWMKIRGLVSLPSSLATSRKQLMCFPMLRLMPARMFGRHSILRRFWRRERGCRHFRGRRGRSPRRARADPGASCPRRGGDPPSRYSNSCPGSFRFSFGGKVASKAAKASGSRSQAK